MDFITPFVRFLLESDYVKQNKVFLNAVKAEDGSTGIISSQIDRKQDRRYADGSVRHKLIFTINDYKSISFHRLVNDMLERNENIADLLEVQKIVEYIDDCNNSGVFPDFGEDYEVESIETEYLTPALPGIDNSGHPLAKYSIPVICYVMDYTGAIK